MRLEVEEPRHGDGARPADASEVVADEVDDHDVLGRVLGQEPVGRRRGALDRRRPDARPVPSQEQFGGRRRDVDAMVRQMHDRAERCRIALGERRTQGRDRQDVYKRQLEGRWKSCPEAERGLWQGLAQLAVALTHAGRGNARGASRLVERGAGRLAEYEATSGPTYGLDLGRVVAGVRRAVG